MVVVISQFTEWILDVRQQFLAINEILDQWSSENSTKPNRIQVLPANMSSKPNDRSGLNNEAFMRVAMLRTIRRAHFKLCDVARIINEVYTWQIFICIAKLFNFNIHQLYTIYKVGDIRSILWVALNTCNLMFITISCALCQNESEKTAQILHKSKRESENYQLNDTVSTDLSLIYINDGNAGGM